MLKNVQKISASVLMKLQLNDNENEVENEKQNVQIRHKQPRHGHRYTKYNMYLSLMIVRFNS